jgi:actin-related protein 3
MEKSENEKNWGNNEEINKNENDNKNIEEDNKEEINKDNTNNDNIEIKDNTEEKQIEKQDDKTEEIINEDKGEIKIEKEINSDNNDKIEGNIEITKEETEKEIKADIETNNENNESEKNIDSNPQQVTMEIIQAEVNPSSENFNQINYEFPKDFMDDKIRCNTLTQKLINKTKRNTELKYEEFFTKKRHYLIMTDGGKPVYSRYGDEVENNSIFATISAMITKFTIFNSTDTFKEELNVISNKKNKIVFMKKGQLIFIAFSKMVNDSVSLLHSQLEMIYNQLMSILTVKFYEKLEDNPSKVLTAMGGTENLFEQIIQYSSNSFVSIFNSYQIMNFENFGESREKINKILEENKGNSLYCILMTPYEIISFAHSNQITVQASDLILIQTLILCTEMLRTQESYVPICLPGISDQGFLQLYSHFSEENIGIIFITENIDPMCFMEFQQKYKDIYDRILEGYSEKIIQCMRKNNNMKGKYSLFKNDNEENKENIDKETLVNNLITKINNMNEKLALEGKTSSNRLPNMNNLNIPNKDAPKGKSLSSNLISNPTISIFNGIKYGVILNRKNNQYIMLNFGMDYRTYTKKEKELIHKYIMLYDVYNNYKDKENNREEFYYLEQSEKYYNLIQVNENFVVIFSFGFFSDIEKIQKKIKDLFKHLKKYENKYFIIYK